MSDNIEEKIEPVPVVEEDDFNLSTAITILPSEIEKTLSQTVNLSSGNVIHEPTCLICSSIYREDVEKKWVETKKHSEVRKVIRTKNANSISDSVIDNHIRFHYERGIREIQKVEYINKITRLNSTEMTTLDRIKFALSALTERIMEINSITPSGDYTQADIERIKSSEVSKLMGTYGKFAKLQADLLGEMNKNGELISIPKAKFIAFFNEAIVNAKTDTEREIINRTLTQLGSLSQS